ncbi:hypothetical protein BH10BAC2_BH10BAC2_18740 [soil metagenome]
MNKLVLVAGVLYISLSACKKETQECSPVTISAPAAEVDALRAYITAGGITATEDSRGFFYTINSAGSGNKPTACNAVTVNYVGKLTNGTTFDSGSGISFYLSQLILGWQEGIPLIAAGGSITLYLPPSLAYGSSGSGSIPPNSNLIFDITLVSVL